MNLISTVEIDHEVDATLMNLQKFAFGQKELRYNLTLEGSKFAELDK